ncbi:hypothetical protein ABZX38_17785 [Streptomyces longwoodensis]|uniref:hypothetical protein n=1 Tax=Streptomyces longwoodensis TaxID=68231 RepID=UPI0033A73A8F
MECSTTAAPHGQGQVTHIAAPPLYAEMVAGDRRLRLAGYEVCWFGGWELTGPGGEGVVTDFFADLLAWCQRPTL